jgi:hypothetical protein
MIRNTPPSVPITDAIQRIFLRRYSFGSRWLPPPVEAAESAPPRRGRKKRLDKNRRKAVS